MTCRTDSQPPHAQGFVHDGLQRQSFAAAQLFVGGDDQHRTSIFNAVTQALRGKPPNTTECVAPMRAGPAQPPPSTDMGKYSTTRSPFFTPCAFSALASFDTPLQQIAVGNATDLTVIRLEMMATIASTRFDMAIETVVRNIEQAVVEPLEKRRVAGVQHLGKGLLPGKKFARQSRPIAFVILLGFRAKSWSYA